jgi:hypothetical protein
MKYSDVEDVIAENVSMYSKNLDKAINLMTKAEEINYAKNMKLIKLRNYQIKCLYDFAEYDNKMPKIQIGDKYVVDRANLVNYLLFENYIKADILYCGIGVVSYLKLIRDYQKDGSEYAIKDNIFNDGILYGMKLKCLPNDIIPRNEFVYIDRESDEIIKYKIEGVN